MKKIVRTVTTLAVTLTAIFCVTAASLASPSPDPTSAVTLKSGKLLGFSHDQNTFAWLGIPYAAPPVNELRWRAPQPVLPWQGQREALEFGPACIQLPNFSAGDNAPKQGSVVGSEDCLSLNIYAPQSALTGDNPLPVMLWIHGGGNAIGSAQLYDGAELAAGQNVIVVTLNYRLGVLGWLRHPALRLPPASLEGQSGNYGTLDLIQGLRWIRDNIASFGGNPQRVTVFGESAGGRNTWSLVQSPLAKGLFHGAIVQSGSVRTLDANKSERYNKESADYPSYVNNTGELIEAYFGTEAAEVLTLPELAIKLRELSPDELYASLESPMGGMFFQPRLYRDGVVLTNVPALELFKDPDAYNRVPIISGTNRDEDKLFMMMDERWVKKRLGFIPQARDTNRYNRAAAYAADLWRALSADTPADVISRHGGAKVYTYRFDWDDLATWPVDLPQLMGAAHGLEIPFIFGSQDDFIINVLAGFSKGDEREALSQAMQSYWGNFAYTGEPGRGRNDDLPSWKAWAADNEQIMLLDTATGGGVRMTGGSMKVPEIKARLAADAAFSQDEKCDMYRTLFLNGYQSPATYSESEYRNFGDGGCS